MASNKDNRLSAEGSILSKPSETNVEADDESTTYTLTLDNTEATDNVSVTYKGVDIHEHPLLTKVESCILTPRDTRDPSYSNLKLPYRVVCRRRLYRKSKEMRGLFIKELEHHELFQNMALDGVRLHRIFAETLTDSSSEIIKLSNKQKTRLERIMAQPL